ncbi:lipid IV(A) 3-deoxy-D-manno-octulosonic acid transferase [Pseudomaricurvus sp. HS19]|uniref:lipid IV(A) 3-deoxy-D-manno-octulosonic acid transferase n=1 Tax=Pseudomaricurvus sp. HS19 TaxID=2692626 RepID=UPI0013680CA7|nr:lipid IV(A) 3-deoxy-D-manno-octulosonic acid transferase [Pseudomaricurvus sp. HS19]MYM63383.1 3-deoxy-D-manno-octulosonic acid transferase [Pseudomaricurvus sp. HS19]
MLARILYTTVFYLILPLVLLRLLWRARKAPAYARRWRERFGWVPPLAAPVAPRVWVHAVSVGETLAALPLMHRLLDSGYDLVVTTTTPTGSERVRAALGDSVYHVYAPYDLPDCLGRFLRRTRPQLAIIMETELWPNTIAACASREIPVLVANARLSARSAAGYGRFASLASHMLQQLTCVAAQHAEDGERFVALGLPPERLAITGNIKFDLTLNDAVRNKSSQIRERWLCSGERLVLLAASTHPGEDELLLQVFAALRAECPQLLLVLVPRHPERFDAVAQMAAREFVVARHSGGEAITADTQVIIGDTMGELMALLGASDLVFMGGTLIQHGGHNFIEPAAWGKPLVSGDSLYNFAEVSRLLMAAEGLLVASDVDELTRHVRDLLQSPQRRLQVGEAARGVAEANRGALQRLLQEVERLLPHA